MERLTATLAAVLAAITISAGAQTAPQWLPPGSSATGGPGGDTEAIVGGDGLVGEIPGSFSIGPAGNATYTIPIETPPGVNGVQPSLALAYSSAVYLAHDNPALKVTGYDFDAYGPATLAATAGDGLRMTFSRNEASSMTERGRETYSLTYGVWQDLSDIRVTSTEHTRDHVEWTLSSVTDRYGNTMTVHWTCDATPSDRQTSAETYTDMSGRTVRPENLTYGQDYIMERNFTQTYTCSGHRPDRITYAGGAASVTLAYEDRPDRTTRFIGGRSRTLTRRLGSVTVRAGNGTLRTYTLRYAQDGGQRSRLESVELAGKNGARLNKTAFSWSPAPTAPVKSQDYTLDRPPSHSARTAEGYSLDKTLTAPADFDGDGLTDILAVYSYSKKKNNKYTYAHHWAAHLNTGTAYSLPVANHGTLDGPDAFLLLDTDGDGRTELLLKNGRERTFFLPEEEGATTQSIGITTRHIDLDAYGWDGTSLDRKPSADRHLDLPNRESTPYANIVTIPADFDGDGETEFLLLKADGLTFISSHGFNATGIPASGGKSYVVTDMDGDGRAEIGFMGTGSTTFWENGGTLCSIPYGHEYMVGFRRYKDTLMPGDFNGDGLTDILAYKESTATWTILLSNGKNFVSGFIQAPQLADGSDGDGRLIITDIDGDGMSDILETTHHFTSTTLRTHLSTGDAFSTLASAYASGTKDLGFQGHVASTPNAAAFTASDGTVARISVAHYALPSTEPPHMVTSVLTGLGMATDITYASVRANAVTTAERWGTGTEAMAPLSLRVVEGYSSPDGSVTRLALGTAVADRAAGRGLMGFDSVALTTTIGGLSTSTATRYELTPNGAQGPVLAPTESVTRVNGTVTERARTSYGSVRLTGDGGFTHRHHLVADTVTLEDLVDGTVSRTAYSGRDEFLMPAVTVTETGPLGGPPEAVSADSVTYVHDTSAWILGMAAARSTTYSRPGRGSSTERSSASHDAKGRR